MSDGFLKYSGFSNSKCRITFSVGHCIILGASKSIHASKGKTEAAVIKEAVQLRQICQRRLAKLLLNL